MRGSSRRLSESVQIAYFGALLTPAEADGLVHESEEELNFGGVDGTAPSATAKDETPCFRRRSPRLRDWLSQLGHASLEERAAILLQLAEVAWANGVVLNAEGAALELASRIPGVDEATPTALLTSARLRREGGQRGTLDIARRGLGELGVPWSALIYFELAGDSEEVLGALLEKSKARGQANRFRSTFDELRQPA